MHKTTLRVRFGETDMAGHVNNAVYLSYLEEARLQFIQDILGLDDVPLILASAQLDFLAQVFFPETIAIESGVSRMGRSSFDMVHRLYRPDGTLALTAVATLVAFDYAAQKSMPVPEDWRAKLTNHWTDAPDRRG